MFQVGYEFEITTELEDFELKTMLKKAFPDIYKSFKIVKDYTVSGWEIVTTPFDEPVADDVWKRMFDFIKANNDVLKTDKTTAFHVNISKKDDDHWNNTLNADQIYHALDIKDILKKFNRVRSVYCRAPERFANYSYIQFDNLKEITMFLNDESYRESRMEELRNEFNTVLDDNRKNIPVAPKKCKGKRYFEFRMIGGEDYHLKKRVVQNCINKFKQAMLTAAE